MLSIISLSPCNCHHKIPGISCNYSAFGFLVRNGGRILTDNPTLQNYQTKEGELIKYKGLSYCWVNISKNGGILLNQQVLDFLNLKI